MNYKKNAFYFVIVGLFLFSYNSNALTKKSNINAKTRKDLTIWYSKPGTSWLEAIPLGNGRIGAMVTGGVSVDRIILNESTLYSREPSITENLPDLTRHIDILSRMIKNGEYEDADIYSTKHVTGPAVPCYQPLGDILLNFPGQDNFSGYSRDLDLADAITKTSYKIGSVAYTREAFVSFPDNVLIIKIRSSKKQALNFNISMDSQHPTTKFSRVNNNEFVYTGQVPGIALRRTLEWVEEWGQQWKYPEIWDENGERRPDASNVIYNGKGVKFETRLRVLQCDGQVSVNENEMSVKDAQEVILAVAIASSFNGFDKDPVTEGANPASLNISVLDKLKNKTYPKLLQNHLADYHELFNRVSINLPGKSDQTKLSSAERKNDYSVENDPSFAALYFQYGRYLLISSSRNGGQPANLQGLWNVDVIPPWGSAYTTNINMQMNYWPAEVTNLSECHQPIFKFLDEITVTGNRVASEMYRLPGWVMHHNSSLWRTAHPVDWYGFVSFWPIAGGWLCQHLWQHYQFTQDVDFLKNTAYPIMKGAAEFYNSWLAKDENGYWVTPVSNSPENQFFYIDEHGQKQVAGMAMASTLDLAVIRELFQNVIDAEKLLNIDVSFSEELQQKISKLYPYQIGRQGQFLEYYKEFLPSPPRHNTSPYYPLYPGNQFTKKKLPEFMEAERNLILSRTASRPGGGGWPAAWYVALWARLGEGERTLPYLNGLIGRTHFNLFSGGGKVFQIDANLGYTGAMAEMFLQSHDDEIQLLPALPGALKDGSVSGLKAVGNFEVSMNWKNGKLTDAEITAGEDSSPVVSYNGKVVQLKMKEGESVKLNSELKRK